MEPKRWGLENCMMLQDDCGQFVDIEDYERMESDLRRQLEWSKDTIHDMEREVETLDNHLTEARAEIERLRKQVDTEIADLRRELERERLRLAACGVAAMQNTEESRKERIAHNNEYFSDSYFQVCTAVDREMDLRRQLAELKEWSRRLLETREQAYKDLGSCQNGWKKAIKKLAEVTAERDQCKIDAKQIQSTLRVVEDENTQLRVVNNSLRQEMDRLR